MITLPKPIRGYFNNQVKDLIGYDAMNIDFSAGDEEALYPPDSVAWKAYKNPVSTFIGGVSAVYMQLAEPRVRSGVWEHSSFCENAVQRIQRTGLAAMMTVYGQKSSAEKMIGHVNKMHERVKGVTPDGRPYSATDPDLLNWVFNTANYGFFSAYDRFGPGVPKAQLDKAYKLASDNVADLYMVTDAAQSVDEMDAYLVSQVDLLEPHPVLNEFTDIINSARLFPSYMRPLQRLLVRAAVSNVPDEIREKVGLDGTYALRRGEETLVGAICKASDHVFLEAYPAVLACKRLGLPNDYLFRKASNDNQENVERDARADAGPDTLDF